MTRFCLLAEFCQGAQLGLVAVFQCELEPAGLQRGELLGELGQIGQALGQANRQALEDLIGFGQTQFPSLMCRLPGRISVTGTYV
jgi:hypothetical protein